MKLFGDKGVGREEGLLLPKKSLLPLHINDYSTLDFNKFSRYNIDRAR